ncbi:hypothetical protein ACFVH6_44550 [Spirillospora sp. NPDC127200]
MKRLLPAALTLLALAGCSAEKSSSAGDSSSAAPKTGATTAATATAASSPSGPPAGWQTVQDDKTGLSLAVPKGWAKIDVTSGDLAGAINEAGVQGPQAQRIRRLTAAFRGKDVLFVANTAESTGGYVENVSGLCAPNNGVPAGAYKTVARTGLTRLGAEVASVNDFKAGGQPGVKVAYSLRSAQGTADAIQFRILMPGDKVCAVTVGTRHGAMLKDVDRIGDSIRAK